MSSEGVPNIEGIIWTTFEPYIVEPLSVHKYTAILCHGRGSTGQVFADELFESKSSKGLNLQAQFPSIKWVFPSAGFPFDHRTCVVDEAQWFGMSSLEDPNADQVRQKYGISESIKYLHGIIEHEVEILDGDTIRIILGGISQGCAVAIHALLSVSHPLHSFVGFCGWLPFEDEVEGFRSQTWDEADSLVSAFYHDQFQVETRIDSGDQPVSAALTPCFLSHNADDDVVNLKMGRTLRDQLDALGMEMTWDEQEHGDPLLKHWIKEPESIDNLIVFLETWID